MPESERIVHEIAVMDMLSLSILVLFLGSFITRHVPFLRDNYIPPAVTGGLIFSLGTLFLYNFANVELKFDMAMRDLLLLVFFSTVGLSAKFRVLAAGGKALAILVAVAAVFLLVQNGTGVGLAVMLGEHPGYGLMGGSVSFAGGHGTAIAWGREAEAAGLVNASAIGIIFATFGLVAGGVMGGPVARFLMARNKLTGPSEDAAAAVAASVETDDEPADKSDRLFRILQTLLVLAICVSAGDLVNRFLFDRGVLLPGFLTSMGVAIVITNVQDLMNKNLSRAVVDGFGEVSLNVFLSMSMMSIQLWTLAGAATAVVLVLFVQIFVITGFVALVVFRLMGRNYDAAVIAAGFTGLGLGATPVAIANMDALTRRFGPSPKAFLVVPLVGAFFIDLLNASIIKFYIGLITRWVS